MSRPTTPAAHTPNKDRRGHAAVSEPDPEIMHDEAAFRAELGWRLRKLRTWDDDLSQDELAARAGVTRNFISAIEPGAGP